MVNNNTSLKIEKHEESLYNFSTSIKKMILYYDDGSKQEIDDVILRKEDIKYILAYDKNIAGFRFE